MVKQELVKNIAKKAKLNMAQAEKLVDAFTGSITSALAKGEKVVYSNFGTFYTRNYPSKVIYHPKLGKEKKMVMLPTNVIKWMPSGNIKDLVNLGIELDNATAHGVRKHTLKIPKKPKISPITLQQPLEKNQPSENSPFDYIGEENSEKDIPIKVQVSNSPGSPLKKETSSNETNKVSIYEEKMGDGTKVESTFGDAIRVYKERPRPFWQKVFKKKAETVDGVKSSPDTPVQSISLSGAGIFDSVSNNYKIEAIKRNINPNTSNSAKVAETVDTIDIKPFDTEKKIEYINLSDANISKELLQKIPEKIARKYKAVPIEEHESEVVLAMADPQDVQAKEIIKKLVQKPIMVKLASMDDINRILDQYSVLDTELNEALKEGGFDTDTASESAPNPQNDAEINKLAESASDTAPAARIVTSLLRRAIRDNASDIHIEPSEDEVSVRFRKDGVLEKSAELPKEIQPAIVSRIKILSNLKIDEQRLPQDGRFSINYDNRKVDFRVSTLPTADGEKVVMRILDKATGILTVEQLGLHGTALDKLNKITEKPHGMILVTGPTGSGKTTTLYALMDKLFSEGVNIVTLEDPIEYRMPGINQSQVNAEINYTFASGLRTIVRQDPDIIMIGEIRDGETAEMAVHAALTGHVVLSTLHTNDAAGATPRLIDMGIEPFLITSSVNAIIAQRLARKVCEHCKSEDSIPEEEKAELVKIWEQIPESQKKELGNELKFYKGKGCKACNNTGYKGRVGLYELLEISEPVKELILKKESSSSIQDQAVSEGMLTMLQDGLIKVCQGTTSVEEIKRITQE